MPTLLIAKQLFIFILLAQSENRFSSVSESLKSAFIYFIMAIEVLPIISSLLSKMSFVHQILQFEYLQ